MTQPHGVWVLYFSPNAETAVSQNPLLRLSHDNWKTVLRVEAYPSCSVTNISLCLAMHVEASIDWELKGKSGSK
jgi:hypothetical protein